MAGRRAATTPASSRKAGTARPVPLARPQAWLRGGDKTLPAGPARTLSTHILRRHRSRFPIYAERKHQTHRTSERCAKIVIAQSAAESASNGSFSRTSRDKPTCGTVNAVQDPSVPSPGFVSTARNRAAAAHKAESRPWASRRVRERIKQYGSVSLDLRLKCVPAVHTKRQQKEERAQDVFAFSDPGHRLHIHGMNRK